MGGASAVAAEPDRNLNRHDSAHDCTSGTPSSPMQQLQLQLQPLLRWISRAAGTSIAQLSCWLDGALTHVLQDSNNLRLTPDKKHVVPEFSPRNPRLLLPLRKLWVFLCLLGMLIWLLLGLVPSIRSNYVVSAAPFDPNHPPAAASSSSATISICACTYAPTDTLYAAPPYTMLVSRKGIKPPSFQTLLAWCDSNSRHTLDLHNGSNPGPWWIAGVLDEMSFQLTAIRAVAPASPILLSPQGWKAARLAEVFRASMAISTAAQARIANAPPAAVPESADVAAGLDAVARLQGSFNNMMGVLLGMPREALTFDMVDRQSNRSLPLHCNAMPPLEQLPVALLEWCKRPQDAAAISDNSANCSDAYGAYVRFCAPALCHSLGPKTGYLQAMQILVALGGMFSLVSVFAFAITWRTVVCGVDQLVDLDGWLASCGSCSCRRAVGAMQQAACKSPGCAWNKPRLDAAGSAAAGQPRQQQQHHPASSKDAGDDGRAPPPAGCRADAGPVADADAEV